MDIMLLHGQGRSPLSLLLLAARLRRAGHQPHLFGYQVRKEAFDTIVARLVAQAQSLAQPYALVGHSLGGILARAALPALAAHPPCGLLMLGSPNHPALLAQRLGANPLYRRLTGDSGQHLGSSEFYATLPVPTVPTLVIAGTIGWRGRWSPFGDRVNDGVVSVMEVDPGAAGELHLVPAIHTLIMNNRTATRLILTRLAQWST